MTTRTMIVAPHPDDETLGLGGSILRAVTEGDGRSIWVVVTSMSSDRYSQKERLARTSTIDRVARRLSIDDVEQLDIAAGTVASYRFDVLVDRLRKLLDDYKPECVYSPYEGDAHSDHVITARAVAAAVKPYGKIGLACYETPSETDFATLRGAPEFAPNLFVDITDYIDAKLEVLQMYGDEIKSSPHPRSLDAVCARARLRGAQVGVEYAEAFMLRRGFI